MKLTGRVEVRKFGIGTKSEHDAAWLDVGEKSFVLRKFNENPFDNGSLKAFDGKTVVAEGDIDQYLFMVRDIQEILDQDIND